MEPNCIAPGVLGPVQRRINLLKDICHAGLTALENGHAHTGRAVMFDGDICRIALRDVQQVGFRQVDANLLSNLAGLRSGNGLVGIEYAQYDSELIVGTTQALTGISTPAAVSGLSSVTAIHAGVSFGVALKSDGTVWAWGENASGQLGNGTSSNSSTPVRSQGGGL